jgi:hypothetical protein
MNVLHVDPLEAIRLGAQDSLDSCSWHYEEGKQLAREEHMVLLRRLSWPGSEPSHLPRSNTPLTRAEYTAWRTLAQPLMKASTQS